MKNHKKVNLINQLNILQQQLKLLEETTINTSTLKDNDEDEDTTSSFDSSKNDKTLRELVKLKEMLRLQAGKMTVQTNTLNEENFDYSKQKENVMLVQRNRAIPVIYSTPISSHKNRSISGRFRVNRMVKTNGLDVDKISVGSNQQHHNEKCFSRRKKIKQHGVEFDEEMKEEIRKILRPMKQRNRNMVVSGINNKRITPTPMGRRKIGGNDTRNAINRMIRTNVEQRKLIERKQKMVVEIKRAERRPLPNVDFVIPKQNFKKLNFLQNLVVESKEDNLDKFLEDFETDNENENQEIQDIFAQENAVNEKKEDELFNKELEMNDIDSKIFEKSREEEARSQWKALMNMLIFINHLKVLKKRRYDAYEKERNQIGDLIKSSTEVLKKTITYTVRILLKSLYNSARKPLDLEGSKSIFFGIKKKLNDQEINKRKVRIVSTAKSFLDEILKLFENHESDENSGKDNILCGKNRKSLIKFFSIISRNYSLMPESFFLASEKKIVKRNEVNAMIEVGEGERRMILTNFIFIKVFIMQVLNPTDLKDKTVERNFRIMRTVMYILCVLAMHEEKYGCFKIGDDPFSMCFFTEKGKMLKDEKEEIENKTLEESKDEDENQSNKKKKKKKEKKKKEKEEENSLESEKGGNNITVSEKKELTVFNCKDIFMEEMDKEIFEKYCIGEKGTAAVFSNLREYLIWSAKRVRDLVGKLSEETVEKNKDQLEKFFSENEGDDEKDEEEKEDEEQEIFTYKMKEYKRNGELMNRFMSIRARMSDKIVEQLKDSYRKYKRKLMGVKDEEEEKKERKEKEKENIGTDDDDSTGIRKEENEKKEEKNKNDGNEEKESSGNNESSIVENDENDQNEEIQEEDGVVIVVDDGEKKEEQIETSENNENENDDDDAYDSVIEEEMVGGEEKEEKEEDDGGEVGEVEDVEEENKNELVVRKEENEKEKNDE